MKNYILNAVQVASDEESSAYDWSELKKEFNYFIIGDCKVDGEDSILDIERNFSQLCCVMESNGSKNPKDYTVIDFYGKIDYLKKESEKYERADKTV